MAEHHQHFRFIGGGLLQTRRDQKSFCQKRRAAATFTCLCCAYWENQSNGLNILFVYIMYPFQSAFKALAVSGIFMFWANFTIEAFKFSWHIITTTPEKETYKPVARVMCTECRHFFPGGSEDEPFICFSCQGFHPDN